MNIQELDAKIENIIHKYVKYYYTDWKNYDRPKYMKLKGTKENSILIVRKSGTYILTQKEIETKESCKAIFEYYKDQEQANYYQIDFTNNSIKLIHKGIA